MSAVVALKAKHSLTILLQIAGLPRSTFFYHQARIGLPDRHAGAKAAIQDVFERSRGR